jgi:aminomethyltransferase
MKVSPFYFLHIQAGAKMAERAWSLAIGYADAKTEHLAVREKVGLLDFSSMGKIDIKGPDAKTALQTVCVNDMNKLEPGKVIYTSVVDPRGVMLDDTTVYMLGDRHYMLIARTALRFSTFRYIESHARAMDAYLTDVTGAFGVLCLQGPNSLPLINEISDVPVDDLARFRFKKTMIADCEVLVSRTGFTGSRGYELFISSEDCLAVWRAVHAAGGAFDLQPCGFQVGTNTLPLEKGFLSGKELAESPNPFEVGLGWTVVTDKDVPCVANEALKAIRKTGPVNKLVGFALPDGAPPVASNAPVICDGKKIGKVTSAAYGWYVDKFIGLAYIKSEYASLGNKIVLLAGETPVEVEVIDKVFFDPERKRL